MKRIGFIGAGVMGRSMILNLLKNNVEVYVYSRTKEKYSDLENNGAVICDSIKECVENNKIIITMVGFPKDVREVYLEENGILQYASEGSFLIDMTTTSPDLVKEINKKALEKSIHFLDAPVSGSDVRASDATLTIMVGATSQDFEKCYPIFSLLGNKIMHEGPVGNGQYTKMANQIAIAGAISGVCEALYYANKVGLDENKTLITISSGAAGSFQMENMAPRILDEDFEPGFYIKHFVKDMEIILDQLNEFDFNLPILKKVLDNYRELIKAGYGDLGTQGLYKYYEEEMYIK